VNTVGEACAIAMEAEKNAILLYSGAGEALEDKEQKKIFETSRRKSAPTSSW